jgi:hypothetical protein
MVAYAAAAMANSAKARIGLGTKTVRRMSSPPGRGEITEAMRNAQCPMLNAERRKGLA